MYKDGDIVIFNDYLYRFGGYSERFGGRGIICLSESNIRLAVAHPDYIKLASDYEVKNLKWGTWFPFDD